MKTQRMIYKELELIPDSELQIKTKLLFKSWLGGIWQALMMSFTQPSQPYIRQYRDRAGMLWWRVYSPATGCSARLASEAELIDWIEQNYYQTGAMPERYQPFGYFR